MNFLEAYVKRQNILFTMLIILISIFNYKYCIFFNHLLFFFTVFFIITFDYTKIYVSFVLFSAIFLIVLFLISYYMWRSYEFHGLIYKNIRGEDFNVLGLYWGHIKEKNFSQKILDGFFIKVGSSEHSLKIFNINVSGIGASIFLGMPIPEMWKGIIDSLDIRHLFSISGFHFLLLSEIVLFLFPGQENLIGAVSILYVILIGISPSSIRAFINIIATITGNKLSLAMNSIYKSSIVSWVTLILYPNFIYSVGFFYSSIYSIIIISIFKAGEKKYLAQKYIVLQAATIFLNVLFDKDTINLGSIINNIVIVPILIIYGVQNIIFNLFGFKLLILLNRIFDKFIIKSINNIIIFSFCPLFLIDRMKLFIFYFSLYLFLKMLLGKKEK